MASHAEAQRRYYRHRKGDHSLCDPARRCEQLEQLEMTEAVSSQAARDAERGPRGQRLWDAMAGSGLSPMHLLLLDEACRIADRLDRLDAALDNKNTWLRFETDDQGGAVVVVVDNAVAEVRQQATALRSLIAEIRASQPKAAGKADEPAPAKGVLSGLADELAARRRTPAG